MHLVAWLAVGLVAGYLASRALGSNRKRFNPR